MLPVSLDCPYLIAPSIFFNVYLSYLCLFVYSGVKHILCFVFVLFFFVLVLYTLCFSALSCFPVSLNCPFPCFPVSLDCPVSLFLWIVLFPCFSVLSCFPVSLYCPVSLFLWIVPFPCFSGLSCFSVLSCFPVFWIVLFPRFSGLSCFPVSLDCPVSIVSSVFSNVYLVYLFTTRL